MQSSFKQIIRNHSRQSCAQTGKRRRIRAVQTRHGELCADLWTTGVCGDPDYSLGSRGCANRGWACPQSTSGRQLCGDVRLGHARRLPTHYGEGRPAWRTDLNRQTIKNLRLQHRKIAVQVSTPDENRSPLNPDPICLKISDHLKENAQTRTDLRICAIP